MAPIASRALADQTTAALTAQSSPGRGAARGSDVDGGWAVGALFAFALVVGAYFTFRFSGRWTESDTATIASSIRAILQYQSILPANGEVYPNGYTFGAVSTFLIAFTGLDLATLLQALFPLISASLVLIAWPLYRELTGSGRGATLATLFLFIQPEFLFVILRGSHERVLRALVLVSLWLLLRSFRYAESTRWYAVYVCLFYLSVYAAIATNSFFGSSYIAAIAVALVSSWAAAFLGPGLHGVSTATRRRLIYVPIFSAVLAFLFNTFIYPPAGQTLGQVSSIVDRLSKLFLTTSPQTSQGSAVVDYDPYATVLDQWGEPWVYFLVSISTYVLMLGSAVVWGRTGLRWLAGARERPTLGEWLLWLFYGAFALQGAASIIADRAGVLGGNLQYRSFPSFVIVAAPMLAAALARWQPSQRARLLAAPALGILTLLAIAKATNEPSISNKWTFYLPSEVVALEFTNRHLKENGFWADFDERLTATQVLIARTPTLNFGGPFAPSTRTYLITDVIRLRAARLGRPLPPASGGLRVYDNGAAQVYRTKPVTPYQD